MRPRGDGDDLFPGHRIGRLGVVPKIAFFRCSLTDRFGDTVAAAPAIRGLTMVAVAMTEVGEFPPPYYASNQKPAG